jgi:hypothetical protein
VQEFHVKLDMGFLGALLEVFTSEESLEADDVSILNSKFKFKLFPSNQFINNNNK